MVWELRMQWSYFFMNLNWWDSARIANFDYQRRVELQEEKEEKERRELMKWDKKKENNWTNGFINKEIESFGQRKTNSVTAVLDLLMEGNAKMKSAVEKGDLIKVATAQLILDTATTKREEYNQKLEDIRKKQKDLDHRKKQLLECYIDVKRKERKKFKEHF